MLTEFNSFIQKKLLCTKTDKILVAVSGGVDSMVLLHLFIDAGYNVALAHCNFNLRDKESDEDEIFVKNTCVKLMIENHFISFSTREYASEKKISIEMAARDLRYSWFNSLLEKYKYTKIATGHHLNDSIETVFINLTRGTGINGITGIKPKNATIIRPLLFATRSEIEEYAKYNKLPFKTDSSNASNEYVRNIIRNEIIPAFKRINPSFEATMQQNLEHFTDAACIFNHQVEKTNSNLITEEGTGIKIHIDKLLLQTQSQTYLFEMLSPYGFSKDTVNKIMQSARKEPGRIFYSNTHKILIDREFLILEAKLEENSIYTINNLDDFTQLPIKIEALHFQIEAFNLFKTNSIACLDAEKIEFPLILRKWETGDSFFPLGMTKKKKLSDFFIDQKLDRFQKEKIWVLESDRKIVWLVGHRIDNRYKITTNTKKVLQLTLQ